MTSLRSLLAGALVAALGATGAQAQGQPFPLTGSAAPTPANAPFIVPAGVRQDLITDRDTLNLQGLPSTFSNWDMVTFDSSSRYVFIPAEVGSGAGLFRYDTQTQTFVNLMVGNASGVRSADPMTWDANNDDFGRLDPATLTPWNSVITGEETTGGRLFEVTNPLAASGSINVVWRSKIPAVAHEGLRFDANGNLYFVDEDNSGCVYKFVPANSGSLAAGQTFVLSVNAYANDLNVNPSQNWNASSNAASNRVGAATWVPITDAVGNALTTADPFAFVSTTGGRTAADEVFGTPYGRPEDVDFNTLASGNQALYFTATSENVIYSVELTGDTTAIVREFVNYDTLNLGTGMDVNPLQNDPFTNPGNGFALRSPDNLAVDHFGDIYIIEDQNPGDIWKARDADRDGVAESIGLFASMGIPGAEPTGFIADPNDPFRFIVCVQHPSSGNDALWSLRTRAYPGTPDDLVLESGTGSDVNRLPGEFVKTGAGGEIFTIEIKSPSGQLVNTPFVLFAQLFLAGSPYNAGPSYLHIDTNQAILLINGISGIFPQLVPASGTSFVSIVPAGLGGLGISAMFQCAALSTNASNGLVAVSEGHELRFTN
ncbi:MAG: DUF839 domain-containing protein [Planctomycetota bacterium]